MMGSAMVEEVILIDRHDTVAVITLNRPNAMNALSSGLRLALARSLHEMDADSSIHAIVLMGAGDRAFSAGLDLKELGSIPGAVSDAVGPDPSANLILAMAACGKPIIGAINGVAVAGGFELALACDILICSDTARFADTHVKVQLMPGWGLSQRLQRIIGESRAKEMSFTGAFIDAQTALDWGLVNRVVAPSDLRSEAIALGHMIGGNAPKVVRALKQLMNDGSSLSLSEALRLESERAQAFNAMVIASDIEARRGDVQASNRL